MKTTLKEIKSLLKDIINPLFIWVFVVGLPFGFFILPWYFIDKNAYYFLLEGYTCVVMIITVIKLLMIGKEDPHWEKIDEKDEDDYLSLMKN